MAPNRKEVASLIETLSNVDLSSLVKSEFLPLTDPREASKGQEPLTVVPSSSNASEDSYWTWSTVDRDQDALATEVTSAAHMEEQLVRDAQRRRASQEEPEQTLASSDDFWAEADCSETDVSPVSVAAQHEAYWTFTDCKALTGSDHTVAQLVQDATASPCANPRCSSSSSAAYWDWTPPPTTQTDSQSYWEWKTHDHDKLVRLDAALCAQEARRVTSAARMEQVLQQDLSDAYWAEQNESMTDADHYWSWQSSSSPTVDTGYWDM